MVRLFGSFIKTRGVQVTSLRFSNEHNRFRYESDLHCHVCSINQWNFRGLYNIFEIKIEIYSVLLFQRNHERVQVSRIFAILGYAWILISAYVACHDLLPITFAKIENLKSFENQQIVLNVEMMKLLLYPLAVLSIIIDFSVRFLVIDSLYHKYKEQKLARNCEFDGTLMQSNAYPIVSLSELNEKKVVY
jgi:hypothetical protein